MTIKDMIQTKRLTISQVAEAPGFAVNENTEDLGNKMLARLQADPNLSSYLADMDGIMAFVAEITSTHNSDGMLHFAGRNNDTDVAYVGVTGMDKDTPELQITVAEPCRRQGYGKEMLIGTVKWLFENTEKELFLYRTIVDNIGSEELVRSIGGVLREARTGLEKETVRTYEIRRM